MSFLIDSKVVDCGVHSNVARGAHVCLLYARFTSFRALAAVFLLAVPFLSARPDSLDPALDLYRAGDCPAAIKLLKEAVLSNPAANLPLGRCYVDTGSYKEAIDPLFASLKDFPSDTRALRLLVSAYTSLNMHDEAANEVHGYLVQHPGSLDAQVESARLQLARGEREQAAAAFQAVLDQSPDFPSALFGLGLTAFAKAQWPEAIQYLSRAGRIAPGVPAIYSALGDVYSRQGNCRQAVIPYKQAFDLLPSNFPTAKSLATCYAALGKPEEVAHVLRSSTLGEARDTEATEMMALALKSDPKALADYLHDVLELNPENVVARKRRAETLEATHKTDEAQAEYLEILKREKDKADPLICFKLASIEEAKGSLNDAHLHYEMAARDPNATAGMHLGLARTDLALKDAPDAQIELAKVGEPLNQTPEFQVMQLEVDVRTSQFDSAATLAAACLAKLPNDAKVLDLAASVAHRQQKFEDEAALIEHLFQGSPGDQATRYRLVRLYIDHPELKKDDRTLELLATFVNHQDPDPEGYFYLASFYRRNKDLANAKASFDLGFSHMPAPVPSKLAWTYGIYARYLAGQRNYQDALTNQLRAVELDPAMDLEQYNLGLVYLLLGRAADAQQVLAKLQAMNSDDAALLEDQIRKNPGKVKTATQ